MQVPIENVHLVRLFSEIVLNILYLKWYFITYKTCLTLLRNISLIESNDYNYYWFLSIVNNYCTRFFINNTFKSITRLKLAKNKANAKQHPEAELLKIIYILHPRYHPKIVGHILKNN